MQYIDARGSLYTSALNDLVVALDTLSVPSQLTEPYSKTYDSPTVREQVSNAKSETPVMPEDFSWHCVHTLARHKGDIWSVAISADGQTLASGSTDKTIKLWNLKTGDLLRTLTGHEGY